MKKPLIAFVILTWNSQRYISACLDSILSCTSFEPHIFIVDNGSDDGTIETLEAYEEEHQNVICAFLPQNLGTTVSRNLVLRELTDDYDFVCVLDSDTQVNDSAIMAMVKTIEGNPGVGIVGPTMKNSNGEVQLSGRNLPSLGIKLRKAAPSDAVRERGSLMEIPSTPIINGMQDVPYLLSACWLMPLSTLRAVGLLDEEIFYAPEDVDYCLRAHQAGLRVVRCWDSEINHEYQRLSHQKLFSKINIEHLKGLVYFFRKHGYFFNSDKAVS